LKKIAEKIVSISTNQELLLFPLFSGTILTNFVNIFGGSFPQSLRIDVGFLEHNDVKDIVKSLNNDYINSIMNSIAFNKIMSYVGKI
jgi:hypothetical protein